MFKYNKKVYGIKKITIAQDQFSVSMLPCLSYFLLIPFKTSNFFLAIRWVKSFNIVEEESIIKDIVGDLSKRNKSKRRQSV